MGASKRQQSPWSHLSLARIILNFCFVAKSKVEYFKIFYIKSQVIQLNEPFQLKSWKPIF